MVLLFRGFYVFRRLPSWRVIFSSLLLMLAIGTAAVVDLIVTDLAATLRLMDNPTWLQSKTGGLQLFWMCLLAGEVMYYLW